MVYQTKYLDTDGFLDVPRVEREGKIEEFFPGLLANVGEIRSREFPLFDGLKRVYLDNGATTQEPRSVLERMFEYRRGHLRGSNHSENSDEAREAQGRYEEAKQKVADFFDAKNYYVAFTSGTTAASNLLGTRFLFEPGDLLLITDMEHNSQVLTSRNFAKKAGAEVAYVPVGLAEGRLDLEALEKMVGERKSGKVLLMLVHASNVTGVVNPVKEIRARFGDRVLIYLDMAQSAGHLSISLDDLDVDFAGVSAHKMYGPFGMGAFFAHKRSDALLGNMVSGGGAVVLVGREETAYEVSPARFEPGTQNIEGAIEWGFAIDFLRTIGMSAIEAHDRALGEYFIGELGKIDGVKVYGPKEFTARSAVATFTVGSSNTNYKEIAQKLNKRGVSVRDGCFCAHLLIPQLLGVREDFHNEKIQKLQGGVDRYSLGIEGALRAAFAFYNTPQDAYQGIRAIREVAQEESEGKS